MKKPLAAVLTALLIAAQVFPSFAAPSFSDVNDSSWAYSYIEEAAALGIINGYSDGSFRPLKDVSRQESLAMLLRTAEKLGLAEDLQEQGGEGGEAPLREKLDIAEWAWDTAAYALDRGIALEGDFSRGGGGAAAPRQQIAAWASKFMNYELSPLCVLPYSDTSYIDAENFPYVDALYRHGIMQGNAGKFNPASGVLRQELAAVAIRLTEDKEKLSDYDSLSCRLVQRRGTVTGVNTKRRTLVLSEEGGDVTLYISGDTDIIIDGKSSDFSSFSSLTGKTLTFSCLIGGRDALLVQTGPEVSSGEVLSIEKHSDYSSVDILFDDGSSFVYAYPASKGTPQFSLNSRISFLSDGVEILEAR